MKIFMSKLNKKYFNMVEIVLALAVVSVAIVSLMGMLPVALRASKNSVAENSVTSVVEIIKSLIDSEYSQYCAKDSGDFDNDFKNKFLSNKYKEDSVIEYSSTNMYPDETDTGIRLLEKIAFRITYAQGAAPGAFKVELFSGKFEDKKFAVTDFDADVRIWQTDLNGGLHIPQIPGQSSVFNPNACTVHIEVRWPSGIAPANQEFRKYEYNYFAK